MKYLVVFVFFITVFSETQGDCASNKKLSGGTGNKAQMEQAGWNVDFQAPNADTNGVGKECAAGKKWFGWSDGNTAGTLSATLSGSGEATINFGNCWNAGVVNLYLDDKKLATAVVGQKSKVFAFKFTPGSVLKLKDEGGNAVVGFNSITFACRNPDAAATSAPTPAPIGSYACYDKKEYNCKLWAKSGWCEWNYMKGYMKDCRKSCGQCALYKKMEKGHLCSGINIPITTAKTCNNAAQELGLTYEGHTRGPFPGCFQMKGGVVKFGLDLENREEEFAAICEKTEEGDGKDATEENFITIISTLSKILKKLGINAL